MEISKFLFAVDKQPKYVVYKCNTRPIQYLYSLLINAGITTWETEFEAALEDDYECTFYSGVGRIEEGFENINCISLSESVFFLGDDIHWKNDSITIENVSLFIFEQDEEEWIPVEKWHTDFLELKIDQPTIDAIKATVEERRLDFLYDLDEDDNEFLAINDGRKLK